MVKISLFLLVMAGLCIDHICIAQNSFQVTDPRVELRDNMIHISCDLLNNKSSEFFEVGVDISDAEGNRIEANTFSGDIGKRVSGGVNKYIQWDLEADHIIKDEKIYFEIFARAMPQTELVLIGRQDNSEDIDSEPNLSTDIPPVNIILKSYSSTGIVFQSLFIPRSSMVTKNTYVLHPLLLIRL